MPSASSLELMWGGRGASMVVSEKPDISTWTVEKPDGTKITIQVNKKDANKY